MRIKDTKKIILEKALELFSIRGYSGVSVYDIAEAVGIKAASLYKHFPGKQAIFDSLLEMADAGYQKQVSQFGLQGYDANLDSNFYRDISESTLLTVGTSLFVYFLHDQVNKKLRMMLTVEQYKNPAAAQLYVSQYIDQPLKYQAAILRSLIVQKTMADYDPEIMAAHFYAPIYLLLCLCDSCPDREAEALQFIKKHIIQFSALYQKEKKE